MYARSKIFSSQNLSKIYLWYTTVYITIELVSTKDPIFDALLHHSQLRSVLRFSCHFTCVIHKQEINSEKQIIATELQKTWITKGSNKRFLGLSSGVDDQEWKKFKSSVRSEKFVFARGQRERRWKMKRAIAVPEYTNSIGVFQMCWQLL